MSKKITLTEYGMSEHFKDRSLPFGKKEPFFYRDEVGQLHQNMRCETSREELITFYQKFVGLRK